MILGLVIAPLCIIGVGYLMWRSNGQQEQNAPYDLDMEQQPIPEQQPPGVVEGEVGEMIEILITHLDAYEQYYEHKIWGNHIGRKMCASCMDLPEGEERASLRYDIIQYITEYNSYLRTMEKWSVQELVHAWEIALKLQEVVIDNPQLADKYAQCWESIVPHVVINGNHHPSLQPYTWQEHTMADNLRTQIIQRKEEYAALHAHEWAWEQAHGPEWGDAIIALAEYKAAQEAMREADTASAMQIAEEADKAAQEAMLEADTALAIQMAEEGGKAAQEAMLEADMASAMQIAEEADKAAQEAMLEADMALAIQMAEGFEQGELFDRILREQQMAEEELVIGDNIPPGDKQLPPPGGGSWLFEFVEWIISLFW